MNAPCDITGFQNTGDFLSAFSDGTKRYHLILLDIYMEGMSGLELAKKIRETDKETDIIFLTSSPDFMLDGYDVHALHYLLKPVNTERLGQLIRQVYEEKYQPRYYMLKSGETNRPVDVKDIIALETVGRKVEITTTDGILYCSCKLADLLDDIRMNHLRRCHQAYAVNISQVQEFTRSDIIMKNKKRVPISRPYLNEVKTAFLMYIQDR